MNCTDIHAIDVHAHYGLYLNRDHDLMNKFMSATPAEIVRRAQMANIRLTMVSPLAALMPRLHADPLSANRDAAQVVAETVGLLQWVVVDPLKPQTYKQAGQMLAGAKCAGIKIHPEEHGYRIAEHGEAIFAFAASHKAIIQSHSGEENSMPEDFVQFANDFPEVTLILSHLGCNTDGDPTHHVRAIQSARHGNMFTDTSSANSIMPNMIEWAAGEIGQNRILFGTDSPCYFAPMQRARIDNAEMSDEAKRLILYENAVRLFKL